MKRILLADDHEMIRQGLRRVLEGQTGLIVCGEASNGRDAVAKSLELKPDVLVLDFAMPDLNGLEVTRQVRAAQPQTEVLILTMHESEQLAREAQLAGARGFVLKSDAGKSLLKAVHHVLQHRSYFSAKLAPLMLADRSHAAPRTATGASGSLTPREREILRLLAEGSSSKEVAHALSISVKTVDTHRANLMRKLDIHSVSELVRYAIRQGVASP